MKFQKKPVQMKGEVFQWWPPDDPRHVVIRGVIESDEAVTQRVRDYYTLVERLPVPAVPPGKALCFVDGGICTILATVSPGDWLWDHDGGTPVLIQDSDFSKAYETPP